MFCASLLRFAWWKYLFSMAGGSWAYRFLFYFVPFPAAASLKCPQHNMSHVQYRANNPRNHRITDLIEHAAQACWLLPDSFLFFFLEGKKSLCFLLFVIWSEYLPPLSNRADLCCIIMILSSTKTWWDTFSNSFFVSFRHCLSVLLLSRKKWGWLCDICMLLT